MPAKLCLKITNNIKDVLYKYIPEKLKTVDREEGSTYIQVTWHNMVFKPKLCNISTVASWVDIPQAELFNITLPQQLTQHH
jgi:hypothetical protein